MLQSRGRAMAPGRGSEQHTRAEPAWQEGHPHMCQGCLALRGGGRDSTAAFGVVFVRQGVHSTAGWGSWSRLKSAPNKT